MNTFKSLKDSYYHRVAIAPSEERTATLQYSDIVLHLPVLEWFASHCDTVVEFGVREAHSTVALLAGCRGVVRSYDCDESPMVGFLKSIALPCQWEFHVADTGDPNLLIGRPDMLFIDTMHTYDHVSKELRNQGDKVRHYLAFHDTFTCGNQDMSGPDKSAKGIMPAIEEFREYSLSNWKTVYETTCNNGLLVLERTGGK